MLAHLPDQFEEVKAVLEAECDLPPPGASSDSRRNAEELWPCMAGCKTIASVSTLTLSNVLGPSSSSGVV